METIDLLVKYFGIGALLFVPIIILGWLNWQAMRGPGPAWARRLEWLRANSFSEFYREKLLGVPLDYIAAKWFGDEDHFPAEKGFGSKRLHCAPFSASSYDFLLRLALIYPIVSVVVVWALGGPGTLGGLTLLPAPEDINGFIRLLILVYLIAFFIVAVKVFRDKPANQTVWQRRFWTILFFGMLTAAIAGAGAGAIAGAGAGAISVAGAVAVAVAGAVAGAGAIAGAVAGAGAISVAVAGAGAIAGAVAGAVAVAVAVAVAGSVVWLDHKAKKSDSRGAFFSFHFMLFLGLSLLAFYISGRFYQPTEAVTLLLFIALLPLINAPLDWLSLGVTRGLLHAVRSGHHNGWKAFGYAVLDFIIALVFLYLMAIVTVASIALANALYTFGGGTSYIMDVEAILTHMRDEPLDMANWWAYVMVGTTLVYTLVHMVLAALAVILWVPHHWLKKVHDGLPQTPDQPVDEDKRFFACVYLTLAPFLAFAALAAVLYLLYLMLSAWGSDVRHALLDLLNWLNTNILDLFDALTIAT